eukprot:1203294-Pleurochrysis_carterae.AAC.3
MLMVSAGNKSVTTVIRSGATIQSSIYELQSQLPKAESKGQFGAARMKFSECAVHSAPERALFE